MVYFDISKFVEKFLHFVFEVKVLFLLKNTINIEIHPINS